MARLKAPFTEWPPMATLGRSGDEALAGAVCRGAGRASCGRSASRSTTRRCSTSTPTRRTRSSATARWPRTPTWWRALGAAIIRGLQEQRRRRLRQALSRATATRRSIRTSSCRSSSIRRIASGASSACRFAAAIAAGVAFIMTAHVLVPSLDEERPATLSPRIVQALLRDELGFEGVILSDDLEMKAIAKPPTRCPTRRCRRLPPAATALLICSGDVERAGGRRSRRSCTRSRTGRIPYKRLEDALKRQRRPRSGSSRRRSRAAARRATALRQMLGCDAHQRVADEMARFLRDACKPRAAASPAIASRSCRPASPFAREEFERGVAELRRLGFEPVYDDSVFAREPGYLGGHAASCAPALHARLDRPVGRGADRASAAATAASQLLPLLDRGALARAPKLFIGYSDNTSLLSWLTCHVRHHGAARPDARAAARRGAERLRRALVHGAGAGRGAASSCAPDGLAVLRAGEARGPAVRRHDDAAAGVARDAVRVRSAGGLRPVSRGRQRAAVPRSIAC